VAIEDCREVGWGRGGRRDAIAIAGWTLH
jgi:hypothetical protein